MSHTHGTPNHTHTGLSTGYATTNFSFNIKRTNDYSAGPIVFAGVNTDVTTVDSAEAGALDNGSNTAQRSKVAYSQTHGHTISMNSSGAGTTGSASASQTGAGGAGATISAGSGAASSANNGNLQPYITCYMWKRTA
jgi:hypothetical protein